MPCESSWQLYHLISGYCSAQVLAGQFPVVSHNLGSSLSPALAGHDVPASCRTLPGAPVQGGVRVPLETLDDQLQHLLVLQEPGQGFWPYTLQKLSGLYSVGLTQERWGQLTDAGALEPSGV